MALLARRVAYDAALVALMVLILAAFGIVGRMDYEDHMRTMGGAAMVSAQMGE